MHIVQLHMSPDGDCIICSKAKFMAGTQLALVFWSDLTNQVVRDNIRTLRTILPDALILGCSTSGIVQDRLLLEETMGVTVISFQHTRLELVRGNIADTTDSTALGASLGARLPKEHLAHVLVLSDGLAINGHQLVRGLASTLPATVAVTGGLAGDGTRFEQTSLLVNEDVVSGEAVCLGLYGDKLRVGHASRGGWEPFGPERLITASRGNVLMELDGELALSLYERYLGKHAQGLPATGHLFPLSVRTEDSEAPVVRTILGVDRERQTLTFSGDMPEGGTVQLMKANIDALVDGAREAGLAACLHIPNSLAVLVSCVGRKMVLRQFADEEVEAVASALPPGTAMAGFYSYGEIAPYAPGLPCALHNQTMTVTVLAEEE